MRIYTAPGVNAYTVNAASLGTRLSLRRGRTTFVIQAWGNCGHVYQAPETITVHWISHWFVEMDAVIT
jgi:hypothetical protein